MGPFMREVLRLWLDGAGAASAAKLTAEAVRALLF